jgi:hypothetical protein
MKGEMVESVKGIEPLPKLVGIRIVVLLTGGSGGGGTTPTPATVVMGVRGLPNKVALVASIIAHRTNSHSSEVTSRGNI